MRSLSMVALLGALLLLVGVTLRADETSAPPAKPAETAPKADAAKVDAAKVDAPKAEVAKPPEAAAKDAAAKTTPPKMEDKHDDSVVEPGHSTHGDAFNEGPRQRAYLMDGMGKVNFTVTTKSPEAQAFFNQGVAQLHGFWYFEAERSFRQALAIDPECAMAYWGMAMANVNNVKRAKEFITKANERKDKLSPREQAWVTPFVDFYATSGNRKQDKPERYKKLIEGLESIVQDYPDDVDAKAFLALTIWTSVEKVSIGSRQAVDSLLDQVFVANPMHPAHHYRIHLWNNVKSQRALASSALCGQSSPGIAHMWHMSGHIYSERHRYGDAAWQQEASARVDHAHTMRDRVLPDQIHNYAHNNEWLIRDLCFIGRAHDAISLAKNMLELPRHPKYNTLKKGSAHYGRDRLLDSLEEYEQWAEIGKLADTMYFDGLDKPDDKVRKLRLVGSALAIEKNDGSKVQVAALQALRKERQDARYAAADAAEAKARKEKKSEDDINKAMTEALKANAGPVEAVDKALSQIAAYTSLAAGDVAAAKTEFDKIKDSGQIRRDQLGHIYSLLGDHAQAETFARAALAEGEVYPQAVLVEVLYRAGKKDEAKAELEKLRPLSAEVDIDVPVFARLTPIAKEFGLSDDWRIAKTTASDVGVRPTLDSLGPFRWQPSPAPSWTLPNASGTLVSLDQFRGKPVVVIFYLGSGCLHCVEQLQKLAPLTDEFAAQGISIVAISSESADSLKTSVLNSADKPMPFPLLSDPEKSTFRSYRAYDDFENAPLHGTLLIDGEGLVRWQDIGYEPFLDVGFVLDEAKRLFRH